MNRLMKCATTATMAVTLLVSGSSAFANGNATTAPSPSPSPSLNAPTEITPFDTSNVIFNSALKDGLKPKFTIPKGYGWVKVWVQNTTNSDMTVRVTQGSLTGTQKMLFTVKANTADFLTGDAAWSTGDFHVAISTANSVPLTGLLSVKLATTKAEL